MNATGKASLFVILLIAAVSFTAPFFPRCNPNTIDLDRIKEPPSLKHPLGTDTKGRDIIGAQPPVPTLGFHDQRLQGLPYLCAMDGDCAGIYDRTHRTLF